MNDVPEQSALEEALAEPVPIRRALSFGTICVLIGLASLVVIIGLQLVKRNLTQPQAGLAPEFTLTLFDGKPFELTEQRGKIVIINFWASWCGPCREEAPILQEVWDRFREQGVVVIGIAYVDTESRSRAFIDEFDITYPNGPDVGTVVADQYRIQGVPETFVVDETGNIAEQIIGPVRSGQLEEIIGRLGSSSDG